MNFVFWTRAKVAHACRLGELTGFENGWRLNDGLALQSELPESASFDMDPNFPDDTLTPDFLDNVDGLVVVSSSLKAFVEDKNLPNVEYLEVTVRDLKGKTVRPPYFIVNPVGPLPLLRIDQCEVTMDSLDKDALKTFKKFVVDEELLRKAPPLFRIKFLSKYLMMSKDLAKEISARGFVGNRWINPEALATGSPVGNLARLPATATAKLE